MTQEFLLPSKLPLYLKRLEMEYQKSNNLTLSEIIRNACIYVEERVEYSEGYIIEGYRGYRVILFLSLFILAEKVTPDSQEMYCRKIQEDLNKLNNNKNEFINEVCLEHEDENDPKYQQAIPIGNRFHADLEILPSTATVETGPIRLFISHRDKYKKIAKDLANELENYGIKSFVAHDTIEPLTIWQEEILKNLETMEVMLAFITDDFAESSWTNQEIGFALGKSIPVIPLKLQRKDPTGFIGTIQAVRGNLENPTRSAPEIYNLLTKLIDMTRLKNALMEKNIEKSNALIEKFVQSSNYNEVKRSFDLMNRLVESLSEDQVKQIIEEFAKNDILHTAFYLTNDHNRLCVFLNRTTNKDYVIQEKEICILKENDINNNMNSNDLNNFNSDLPF